MAVVLYYCAMTTHHEAGVGLGERDCSCNIVQLHHEMLKSWTVWDLISGKSTVDTWYTFPVFLFSLPPSSDLKNGPGISASTAENTYGLLSMFICKCQINLLLRGRTTNCVKYWLRSSEEHLITNTSISLSLLPSVFTDITANLPIQSEYSS